MSRFREFRRALRRNWPFLISWYDDLNHLRGTYRVADLIRSVVLAAQLEERGARSENGRVVVINTIRTYIGVQLCIECLLALKLNRNGYDVKILFDDGRLRHHDTLTAIDYKPFRSASRLRRSISLRILKRLPMINEMLTPYSEFISSGECSKIVEASSNDRATDIEPIVEASLVRFFLSAPDKPLLESEPDYARARTMFVANARISQLVAERVIDKYNPQFAVTSHGIYSTWGSFRAVLQDRGVRTICWGSNGYAADKIDVAVNDIAANKSDGGYYSALATEALNESGFMNRITNEMTAMLDRRIKGKATDIANLGGAAGESDCPEIKRIVEAQKHGTKLFALFPNVMWDNATTFKEWNRVFDSPVDWLVETTRFIMNSTDRMLIIRAHPAEYLWMTVRVGVRDMLKFQLGEEPFCHPNIMFIPPERSLSSYLLFEHLDGATVYNGTIGPELIHAQVPLILGARAAYSDKGFTWEPQSKEDYFAAFDRTDDILSIQEDNRDRLMLFLYEYFDRHGVRVKFLHDKISLTPRYSTDPYELWSDPGLERLVATAMGEREFHQEWPSGLSRSERVDR